MSSSVARSNVRIGALFSERGVIFMVQRWTGAAALTLLSTAIVGCLASIEERRGE